MLEPLHEHVINYKMQADNIMNSSETDMWKMGEMFSLDLNYAGAMKLSDNITMNDIHVWGALMFRYMRSF